MNTYNFLIDYEQSKTLHILVGDRFSRQPRDKLVTFGICGVCHSGEAGMIA